MKKEIEVKGIQINVYEHNNSDYVSISSIAKFRDKKRTDYIIQNWLKTRSTIELLGIWEKMYKPSGRNSLKMRVDKRCRGNF